MGLSHLASEQVAAWGVIASCQEQGVPVKVTDPTVIRKVGVLLGTMGGEGRGEARSASRPSPAGLQAPGDGNAGRVHCLDTGGAGGDHRVVDDSSHDGVLP